MKLSLRDETHLYASPSSRPRNLVARQKLTKRFLMSLPAGWFMQSNCHTTADNEHVPILAETVTSLDKRSAQWQRVKNAGANDRLCNVYRSVNEYLAARLAWQQALSSQSVGSTRLYCCAHERKACSDDPEGATHCRIIRFPVTSPCV